MRLSITSHKTFTPGDGAILLIDHQPGVLKMVGSLPADLVARNVGVLAQFGEELRIPLVVTSTRENLDFLGTNLPSIQKGAPIAYAARIRRPGTLNAFHDPAFVVAVKSTKRKNLIVSGPTTDVCLLHSVISAVGAGYQVQVVADASGTSTPLADNVTYDRIRNLGAIITTTFGILFELYPDLSKPEGQRAEGVAASSMQQHAA